MMHLEAPPHLAIEVPQYVLRTPPRLAIPVHRVYHKQAIAVHHVP